MRAIGGFFDLHAFRQRGVPTFVHDPAYFATGHRFCGHDIPRQLKAGRQQCLVADHFVDESPISGGFRVEDSCRSGSVLWRD